MIELILWPVIGLCAGAAVGRHLALRGYKKHKVDLEALILRSNANSAEIERLMTDSNEVHLRAFRAENALEELRGRIEAIVIEALSIPKPAGSVKKIIRQLGDALGDD